MDSRFKGKDRDSQKEIWHLICQSQRGDEEAFEKLIRLRREPIYWLAFQMLGNSDEAQEITQLAFIKLWKVLRKFKEIESFDFWLRRLVTNLCLDELRKRKKERKAISLNMVSEISSLKEPAAEDVLYFKELQRIFNQIANKLAAKQRAAFVLIDINGLSTAEVSRIMGCSSSTVRSHLMLARRFLRQQIESHYPEYVKDIKREK